MSDKPIIEVHNISKKYKIGNSQPYSTLGSKLGEIFNFSPKESSHKDNQFWALKDVSFNVFPGEVVGIIGKNGSGKSTLLKILSRITWPTKGEATIRGKVASLLEVGTGFNSELTGRENIFLNGAILGMGKKEISKKFDEIVDFSGVEKFIDTPVKHYSSGMYMRLAFSIAAHLEPDILFIDEVLAVGDTEFQKKCLGKMDEVSRKEGRTIIFVSHNMLAVQRLCQRTVLLHEGKILMIGDTQQIIKKCLFSKSKMNSVFIPPYSRNNGEVQIIKCFLCDSNYKKCSEFKTSDEISVNLEFSVISNGLRVIPSIHLYNESGECIFASMDLHEPELSNKRFTTGRYNFNCLINGNLLNDGAYTLSFVLSTDTVTHVVDRYEQVLSFRINEDFSFRGDYDGHWIGIIKPKLKWTLNKL